MNKSRSLDWLCLTVFILLGMPRLNIKIGPIPIYAIDILLIGTFLHARRIRAVYRGRKPFAGIIKAILLLALVSEVSTMVTYGEPLQPIYLMARTILAFSLFFSASRIIQSSEDLQALFKVGVLGLIITALMMIMSSLSPTRSITNILFSYSFLEPASEDALAKFSVLEGVKRGRSLVGVSIMSGAFLNTFWPYASLLYKWPELGGRWKYLAMAGTVLAPLGVVMSYSRGAILGLFFVVGGVLFFGSGYNRKGIILAVLIGLTIFNSVGWDSDYFFFDRLENRVTAMMENPYADARETERIYAYTEPFNHVMENPLFLFFGEGLSVAKVPGAMGGERHGRAYHAIFAEAYYSYGMISAFLYVLLVVRGFAYLRRQIQRLSRITSIPLLYARALFASLLGILPWLLFGHAVVSTPRGAMLFFLLFGMIASLKNFQLPPGQEVRRTR